MIRAGSDSSSEQSKDHPSEEEQNSFIIQRKKKLKNPNEKEIEYIESSPNKKFSRCAEKKFSEKHHIAYLGIDNDRGCEIIWNEIKMIDKDVGLREKLFKDLKNLKNISCDNTSSVFEVWKKDDSTIVFITDSFGGGSIRQYLAKIGKQKLKVIKSWLSVILQTLKVLHSFGLIFRDLNCGRIFFNGGTGAVAIGDLFITSENLYKVFDEKVYEMFSTKCIAPELIKDEVPSQKADVYSLGMILIEMITLEIPYTNLPDKMIIQSKIKGEMPEMFDRIGDEKMKSFIAKLIQTDPNKRPTIEELIEDNFLKISSEDDLVIKIKPRKKNKRSKKLDKDEVNTNETIGLKGKNLFKRDFEETPYFEEIKKDQRVLFGDGIVSSGIGKNSAEKRKKSKNIELDPNLNHIRKEDVPFKPESNINLLQIVTSSHEGATPYCSKYFSDVYHPSTDHNKPQIERNSSSQQPGQVLQEDKQTYKIIDDDYNVHLKFLINQDNKLHELQFTYNLLKDNIPDLMEEIKNEFDFSYENLNHIYETLKKVHIYSKFDKNSELLPDNSF